jgi:hypothetical protein
MTDVQLFSERLTQTLGLLSWEVRNALLVKIGHMELQMRSNGQCQPVWTGPVPEVQLLGREVVVPTDVGERRGIVVCFGVMNMGAEYERSVVVHVPASGTVHEAPGSSTRLASAEDSRRIQEELAMARKLSEATERVQAEPPAGKARRRGHKDPALQKWMLEHGAAHPNVRQAVEGGGCLKLVGLDGDKRLYVFRGQLRVDVSGFVVGHPSVRQISEAEAKEMHLGKVRGQFIFEDPAAAREAFELALSLLG